MRVKLNLMQIIILALKQSVIKLGFYPCSVTNRFDTKWNLSLVDDSSCVCMCRLGEEYGCGCPGRWARAICFLP